MTVINFEDFRSRQEDKKANNTLMVIEQITSNYLDTLIKLNVDLENPDIAADVAAIHYLMSGMAHRIYGEQHTSHMVLDKMKAWVM